MAIISNFEIKIFMKIYIGLIILQIIKPYVIIMLNFIKSNIKILIMYLLEPCQENSVKLWELCFLDS
jgi:hypothetical protein